MKFEKQNQAKILRLQGKSINYIAKQLNVAKSSVSLWVRDITLTNEQKETLLAAKNINFLDKFSQKKKEDARIERKLSQDQGKIIAQENNILHCMGCMLFWAEGNKDKNSIVFTNSDVNMNKLFVKFLKECLKVKNDDIKISVNCFINQNIKIESIHDYWVAELDIAGCKIQKPTIKYTNNSVDNFGICRICVYNTKLAQQLYGAIQQYAQFNNDLCLDNKRSRKINGGTAES